MKKLISLDQLRVGTRLKIISDQEGHCYGSVSVKKLIKMNGKYGDSSLPSAGPNDTEILLNRKRNYYFSMNKYLMGSSWVKEAYVLDGIDNRLKESR